MIIVHIAILFLVIGTSVTFEKFRKGDANKWDGFMFGMYVLAWWNICISVVSEII